MIIDPDKKVEKGKKERPGLYQSTKQPYHYENEGSEFSETTPDIRAFGEDEMGEELQNPEMEKNKSER